MERPNAWIAAGGMLIAAGLTFSILPKSWIENVLGFEPDGGSGVIELLLAVILILAGLTLVIRSMMRTRQRGRGRYSPS